MDGIIIDSLLGLSAAAWLACVFVNLSIQLHYSVRSKGFLGGLFRNSLKGDYTSVADKMSSKDRMLYLLTLIGIVLFFLPGGHFIGTLVYAFLK